MAVFMSKEKTITKVVNLSVEDIIPNPHQPRLSFNDDELVLLADSIKQNGILQPLTVRRGETAYEIVSGERRLRAAKMVGFSEVPCIIVDVTERNSAVLALVENIQRQDLNYFEEALAIAKLIDFYGMTQDDAAIRLGKAQSTIANKLRLLNLSDEERNLIIAGNLTERHARAFLKLKSGRFEAIQKVVQNNLNVEKTEKMIEQMLSAERERESLRKRSGAFRDVRLFVNTINKAIETMKAVGIAAESKKTQNNEYIEYVVRIPINKKLVD